MSMGFHDQHTHISLDVHGLFDTALGITAVCHIIEIVILSNDPTATLSTMHPFMLVKGFFATLAGYLLMASTNEQTSCLMDRHLDVDSYGMMLMPFAFLAHAFSLAMVALYETVHYTTSPVSADVEVGLESSEFPDYECRISESSCPRGKGYRPVSLRAASDEGSPPAITPYCLKSALMGKGRYHRSLTEEGYGDLMVA
ncbi:hypothetical protein IWQ60_002478 [Tieghemiomyces parasiticus]|uniref:Protein YTP1-like C-terminal domain-containing protein n=1 Tax=Tieghemiomyces parasiticus TaxID=78921 RepID=A0A9W8AIZ6_9FUNG|nr:hypothetical protein IWQ60_002478 [Tieghemiomyces parasiticus]